MTPAVTVVGSINLDLVVRVAHLPGAGETVVGLDVATAPGGKGANQAAAAAALSDSVAMVGRIGSDGNGAPLRADLADRGVDVLAVTVAPGPTGQATIAVEKATGENLIIVAAGANALLESDHVRIATVGEARVVLLQLEIPLETVIAAAGWATGLVVLNPAPPRELPAELLALVDVLVPNEMELTRLTGATPAPRSNRELVALARTLGGDRDVVITLGSRGALVVGPDHAWHVAAPKVDAVDTTGAGDCFCGALAASLAHGAELIEATMTAVAAAAISTTGVGARGALPNSADVKAARLGVPPAVAVA